MDSFRPLFVLGNPRSGTSLFRLMLTTHPSICVPPECGFIQWWYEKYKDWTVKDVHVEKRVNSFVMDIAASKKIETWGLDFDSLKAQISLRKPQNYGDLCLCVILEYATQSNKTPIYLGDKNNYYVAHLELIRFLYPDAKYLIIVRDGRDVACSYIDLENLHSSSPYKPRLSSDVQKIAAEWMENNEKLLSLEKLLPDGSVKVVRYEDLVANPEKNLKEVCDFLDIDFTLVMLDYHLANRRLKLEPGELLAWKAKTLNEPDINNIGRYKRTLSEKDIRLFYEIAGVTLEKLGYEQ